MFRSLVKFILVFVFLSQGIILSAQTTTSSGTNTSNPTNGRENDPYSKFGIGDLMNGNNAVLRGMGNITSAYESPTVLNTDNPSSLAFLDRTTFEMGATGSTRSISSQGLSYTTGTATLSYFTLAFPVSKRAGMCFGFKPISHVYYNMADTISSSSYPPSPLGQVARSYYGDGGLNYAYIGGAWRYKGFAIGATAGYLFGTISNITAAVPIDTQTYNRAYTAQFANYDKVGGLYWKAGAIYEQKLDSDYSIRVGATFALAQNLSDRFSSYQVSTYYFTDTTVNDTSSNSGVTKGTLRMPTSFSAGVMLSRNAKWDLGLDFSSTQWSQFNNSVNPSMNLGIGSQSYKFAFGGQIIPDVNNARNYFSRVTYRFGVYYGKEYLNLSNTQLPVFGLTAGGSLPFRRTSSQLHIALDAGRLGTAANNLIQETYFRFTLGITFNDRWFVKRRYD